MRKRTMNTRDHNRDTFLHWIEEHPEPEGPRASNPRSIKTKTQRDRLIRMEMMLNELTTLKQIIGEARSNDVKEI